MRHGVIHPPAPANEVVRSYAPGSPERASIQRRLKQMLGETVEVPLRIGGRDVRTGEVGQLVCPHDHAHVLGTFHQAGEAEARLAADAAKEAWRGWSEMPWEARAAVFLKAADLLAGPWRDTVNAATMLNQSKTVFQAEIDAACEMVDFWRFNVHYMRQIYEGQPYSPPGQWNYVEYRPLEGFVFAVTPFNFTSIGGNLPSAPAMLGNVVLWKPASTAILSNYYLLRVLEEAGLPPGVINFIPGSGAKVGDPVFAHESFAGLHFTGSTPTFQGMWKTIADNLPKYRTYPRLVGETGGKDFVFAHPSADPAALATSLLRGAFEYQGQKCSAASRAYVPRSLWNETRDRLGADLAKVKMGDPADLGNFMAAVIDAKAYKSIMGYIDYARSSSDAEVLFGGKGDDSKGWFIEPTVVQTQNPNHKLMREEIFGPVLTIYVYDDAALDETLEMCDRGSPYALTGAVFARDRAAIVHMATRLRHAAGNFYINDKPTGAVVGQQPFGGGRASGTNDKAGSPLNLLRWVSQRAIKETFVTPTSFPYPHMDAEESEAGGGSA
jgi:1-pyrroline-5-carboxylate dehydrogenase